MKRTLGISRSRMQTLAECRQNKKITTPLSQFEGLSRFSSRRLKGEIQMVDAQNLKKPFMEQISTAGTIEGARPTWLTLYQQCQTLLLDVEDLRKQMLQNQNKRLSCVKVSEEKECEVKIYECAKEATRRIRQCEKILEKIEAQEKVETAANAKVCQSLCFKLASEIQQTTRTLRAQEKSFVEQRKQFEQTQKVSFLDVAVESALSNEDEEMRDLEERNQQIKNIVESIYELNAIYKELNHLVILQGSLLDRIDENVETSRAAVQSGHKHLVSAEKRQKRSSRCACKLMIVLVVAIAILLIILIVRWFG